MLKFLALIVCNQGCADRDKKQQRHAGAWRFQNAMRLLLAAGLALCLNGIAEAKNYIFRLNNIKLYGTVSPHSDTDTAILTVKVGTQVLGPSAVSLGDLHGGDVHPIQLELGPVPVLDDDQVTIYYQIINNGNGRDVGPIVAAVGQVVKAAAPIAGGIDPIAGQIVTALGTLAGDVGAQYHRSGTLRVATKS
jgi:hypothetical protein